MVRHRMSEYHLLTIEDVVQVSDKLLITPDFPIFDDFDVSRALDAVIRSKAGYAIPCRVELQVAHFNIPESDDPTRRWRVVPNVLGVTTEQISSGDELYIFDEKLAEDLKQAKQKED
ncbi:MAG: hypothetical protein AAFW60_06430 [Pseudomonadota bacterium]